MRPILEELFLPYDRAGPESNMEARFDPRLTKTAVFTTWVVLRVLNGFV
jgi:hypothetical protein